MSLLRALVVFFSGLIFVLSQHSSAESVLYIDVQSGSLMGRIHTSFGVTFNDAHNLLFGVGYVSELDDHEEMGLVSLRYRYDSPIKWKIPYSSDKYWTLRPLNLGIGLLHSLHHDLSFQSPSNTPDGYYGPQDTRFIFNYQIVLSFTPAWESYIDFSMLDMGISGYVKEFSFYNDNYKFLGLEGVTSWGVGVRYRFK